MVASASAAAAFGSALPGAPRRGARSMHPEHLGDTNGCSLGTSMALVSLRPAPLASGRLMDGHPFGSRLIL